MEPVYTPVVTAIRALFALQGLSFRVEGAEHVPSRGGAVMVLNHIGYLDFAYAGLAARPSGRLVRFMAKQEVFTHPVSGPLMRGMKHIPVDRSAGMASFRAALAALKQGEVVGVFPEATISRSFELKEFKPGAVRLAQAARVPLVPTIVWGSQRVWTKDHPKRLGRTRTPISLTVGEPLAVDRTEDTEAATAELRTRMTAMLHRAQDTYPPLTGDDAVFLPARLGGRAPTPERAAELDAAEAAERLARG